MTKTTLSVATMDSKKLFDDAEKQYCPASAGSNK